MVDPGSKRPCERLTENYDASNSEEEESLDC